MTWDKDIFIEKSLLQIYVKARVFSGATFNRIVLLAFLIVLAAALLVNFFVVNIFSYDSLIVSVRRLADVGITYATSILGFLIGGFAIFASVTSGGLFLKLAKLDSEFEGISQFKFVFFSFMFCFVHYVAFLAICIGVKVLCEDDGLLSYALTSLAAVDVRYIVALSSIGVIVLASWLVFVVLLLKSFLWNLYQSLLLVIAASGLN